MLRTSEVGLGSPIHKCVLLECVLLWRDLFGCFVSFLGNHVKDCAQANDFSANRLAIGSIDSLLSDLFGRSVLEYALNWPASKWLFWICLAPSIRI